MVNNSDILKPNEKVGNYVLHIAFRCKKSSEEIIGLIEKYPKAARQRNGKGEYPLDCAINNSNFYTDSLLYIKLISAFKPAIQRKEIKYNNGYKLHSLCSNRCREHVVLTIINEFPLAVTQKNIHDSYPLHIACANKYHSDNVIFKLFDVFPQAAREKDIDGCYPLHRACNSNQSDSVVLKLLSAFPNAAKKKDKKGKYPLHLACRCNQSEEVVLALMNTYPQAIKEKCHHGYPLYYCQFLYPGQEKYYYYSSYPLFMALQSRQSEKVVNKLIHEFPQAAKEKNRHGRYALHMACKNNYSESVVLKLMKVYIQAAKENDNFGCYPLHHAIIHQSESVVLKFIEKLSQAVKDIGYPTYMALKNNYSFGNSSLCQAIVNHHSEQVFLKIITCFPQEALAEQSLFGECPFRFACKYKLSERVVLIMINYILLQMKHHRISTKVISLLRIAKQNGQSSSIIQVLEELMTKSEYDLQNCFGIPKAITIHGLDNLRRNETFQWILYNSPMQIAGKYYLLNYL
jgi:ankyrin repeat protein